MGKIIIILFCAYMVWQFLHKFSTTPNLSFVEQIIVLSIAGLFGALAIFYVVRLIVKYPQD